MAEQSSIEGARDAWSYRTGGWYAVFGREVTLLLPASQRERVAGLWSVVDGGAGFDEVLDALLASGLRSLPGFVLVGTEAAATRILVRGEGVTAALATAEEEIVVDGSASSTWSERVVEGVAALTVLLDEEDEEGETPDYPIVDGLVRVSRIDRPAVDAPGSAAGVAEAPYDDPLPAPSVVSWLTALEPTTSPPVSPPAPPPASPPPPPVSGLPPDLPPPPRLPPIIPPPPEPPPARDLPVMWAVPDHAESEEPPESEAHAEPEEVADPEEETEAEPHEPEQLAPPRSGLLGAAGRIDPLSAPLEQVEADQAAEPGERRARPWHRHGSDDPPQQEPSGGFDWDRLSFDQPLPDDPPVGGHVAPDPFTGPLPSLESSVDADETSWFSQFPFGDDGDERRNGAQGDEPGALPWPEEAAPVARLLISDGQSVLVDRVVLIGRSPEALRYGPEEQPILVAVPSRLHEISSTHVEIRPGTGADRGTAVVMDMASTNGTILERPGGLVPEVLEPGVEVPLAPGAVLNIGDGISIRVVEP